MTFRDQLIVQRIQEGASVRAVAQEFGTSHGAVVLAVCRAGGSFPEADGRNKIIEQRYREGVPQDQIARDLDVSLSVVQQQVRRARRHRPTSQGSSS